MSASRTGLQKRLAEGWEIHSCYEAGASGYWLHRDLVAMGVKNLVVTPKPMDKGGKKQKSDKRDGGAIVRCAGALSARPG
jgi:transposase